MADKETKAREYQSILYFKEADSSGIILDEHERKTECWSLISKKVDNEEIDYDLHPLFDTSNPSAIINLARQNGRSLKIWYPGQSVKSNTDIDLSVNNMFTISFWFKIPREYLIEALLNDIEFPAGFRWNQGEVRVFVKPKSNTCKLKRLIRFTFGNINKDIEYDFETYDGHFINVMITVDTDKTLRLFIDGIKFYHKVYTGDIEYIINSAEMGLYETSDYDLDTYYKHIYPITDTPQIEFDELAFCTDCLAREEFDVESRSIHNIFPECEIETESSEERSVKVVDYIIYGAPNFYTADKSKMDKIIDHMEIQRHNDYKPSKGYKSDEKEKYKFDDNDQDHIASSYFSMTNKEERNNL